MSASRILAPARSCLRAFFGTSFVLLTITFFAVSGGPPTQAEVSEIRGAYAGVLSNVESAAHNLRMEACASGADCRSPVLAPAAYASSGSAPETRPA
ncbi:MAG TPA: hypothetical protein VG841_04410 [Caulobacterales bacterium]|nr:hypothetical protein [Caulobacterales bacterium]